MIVDVLVYLANTIRSQSFSPSQRFDPTRALRLCFTPHPPVGFRPSEFFPLSQPLHLSMPRPLMPLSVTSSTSKPALFIERLIVVTEKRSVGFIGVVDRLRGCRDPIGRRSKDLTRSCDTLDFRVLIRLSVRTHPSSVTSSGRADTLLAFTLSKAYRIVRWACALPSCTYVAHAAPFGLAIGLRATGYRCGRSWDELRELIQPS